MDYEDEVVIYEPFDYYFVICNTCGCPVKDTDKHTAYHLKEKEFKDGFE